MRSDFSLNSRVRVGYDGKWGVIVVSTYRAFGCFGYSFWS